MKVETIPYIPGHAFELLYRRVQEADFLLTSITDWEKAAVAWHTAGPSFTMLIDGRVEACSGVALRDKAFGECWAFVPSVKRGMLVYRWLLGIFNAMVEEHKFRRLQAFVAADFENGIKLVERLGMKYECSMQKYGAGGETVNLYGRIF